MNIEEKLLIAKSLNNLGIFYHAALSSMKDRMLVRDDEFSPYRFFDPEQNDADAFKVLQALVDKDGADIIFESGEYLAAVCNGQDCYKVSGKTLNEALCRAYLNTIGEEG